MVLNRSCTSNHALAPQFLLFLVRIVRNGHGFLQHGFSFSPCSVFLCRKLAKKICPMSLSLLASLPMNYDNKQRPQLQMEEAILCLLTAELLGWIMFDPGMCLIITKHYIML